MFNMSNGTGFKGAFHLIGCYILLWLSPTRLCCHLCSSQRLLDLLINPVYALQGAALEDGRLKRGDQIIAVNGHCLEGAAHAEAVDILKRTKGTVVLTVLS